MFQAGGGGLRGQVGDDELERHQSCPLRLRLRLRHTLCRLTAGGGTGEWAGDNGGWDGDGDGQLR